MDDRKALLEAVQTAAAAGAAAGSDKNDGVDDGRQYDLLLALVKRHSTRYGSRERRGGMLIVCGGGSGLHGEIQNQYGGKKTTVEDQPVHARVLHRTVFGLSYTFTRVALFELAAAVKSHMPYKMNAEHIAILRRCA